MRQTFNNYKYNRGFTIVELLVVIVVIGILASITMVAYTGITQKANAATLQSDLKNASTLLEMDKTIAGTYPTTKEAANGGNGLNPSPGTDLTYTYISNTDNYTLVAGKDETSYFITSPGKTPTVGTILDATLIIDIEIAIGKITDYKGIIGTYPPTKEIAGLQPSPGVDFTYTYNDPTDTYTLIASKDDTAYSITSEDTRPVAITVPVVAVSVSPYIQTITAASCPTTRTQVQDARDSHTYWVQKLADGKCWMLTNLGYAGSGTNTYSDTKTLTNGTDDTYTVASYYVTPSTTNFTTEPTAPSTSTDGTGQYGYLYNWCAATGGDLASSGCSSTITTPLPVTTASICPSGWRLPTSNGGEFTALNTAINGGSTTTDAGLIGTPWLAQRGGVWDWGFSYQGSVGYYWSSTQYSATDAYYLVFHSTGLSPASNLNKFFGFAVRCIAV